MDIISPINNSISLVKRLREISKNISEAEFKNLLADLSGELADLKIEIVSFKEELEKVKEENRVLRSTAPDSDEKPIGTKWGCYRFENDDGLYCTACWDSNRKKSRTNRFDANIRHCPVCKAAIGS